MDWMIYGANGYTGRRIAEEAAARGLKSVLAGRSARQLADLAQRLSCPYRVFSLDNPAGAADHLEGIRVVLHCAGPFSSPG